MINESQLLIERVQTGVRMEKRLLKVLKALAEYHDLSLGDLLEGIVLHAFDGKTPFSAANLKRIHDLKKFYALDLDSSASHGEQYCREEENRGEEKMTQRTANDRLPAPWRILHWVLGLGL